MTILFYTNSPRIFRTTFIGHLYEICQKWPVVLLSEKLDKESEAVLGDKKLFPNLKEIVPVRQFDAKPMGLWARNKYLHDLAKSVISRYRPEVVISDNDICLFEMYLFREAKKIKAKNVCFQGGFFTGSREQIARRLNLEGAHLRTPSFLPFGQRLMLAKLRKSLGHIFYYWFLPLMAGEKPFPGKSSYISWRGNVGMRDADYYVVFSRRDFDIAIGDGVPAEKLAILAHPWQRQATRKFLERSYFKGAGKPAQSKKKILTIMLTPEEISFRKGSLSLIKKEELLKSRKDAVALVAEILKDWRIFIKPHPDTRNIQELTQIFKSISERIEVADKNKLADEFIAASRAIMGFPPSDTAVFTSPLQCPGKPVLSLDLQHELLGDSFRDFPGIDYIDSRSKLIDALGAIGKGRPGRKGNRGCEGFSGAADLLKFVLKKKIGVFMPSSESGGVFQLGLSIVESLNRYSEKFGCQAINFSQEAISPIKKAGRFLGLVLGLGGFNVKDIDLLIYPTPFTYGFPKKTPYLVFIPNLMHRYYPNFPEFNLRHRLVRDIVYKIYAKKSVFNIVDSEQGAGDIQKFFGIKKEKSRIIPFVPPAYVYQYKDMNEKAVKDVLGHYRLPEKFIFYPAQFWFHKNHARLIKAIDLIKERYQAKVNVVLTGPAPANSQEQIFQLGYVSEKEIVALYKKAVALVFPSLLGPTDIPCLEAMVLGTPVVCSNLFEIPKQVGNAGLFFNPFDTEEMAEKIYEIWTKPRLRRQLAKNGRARIAGLTLENYAKKWEKVIEEALC